MAEKMRPCRVCRNSVAESAKSCPKCGSEDPLGKKAAKKSNGRMVGLVVIVIACVAWVGYFGPVSPLYVLSHLIDYTPVSR